MKIFQGTNLNSFLLKIGLCLAMLVAATGRAQPEISVSSGTNVVLSRFVNDGETSPLIDLGNPLRSAVAEPMPNGDVVNLGVYGGTTFSSKSPTNAYLFALTASSGGRLEGAFDLVWAYGNLDPTNTISLEYSFDNGASWTSIVTSVAITNRSELWVSDAQSGGDDIFPTSPIARWRLTVDGMTNVIDMTDSFFALRNSPFRYYLNDTLDPNDVFTSAPGNDLNLGFFPNAPKATLANLLAEIDVEGDDSILFDTGTYTLSPAVTLNASDGGASTSSIVVIQGSTNAAGSRLEGAGTMLTLNGSYLLVSNLTVAGGIAVASSDVILTDITVDGGSGISMSSTGSEVRDSEFLGAPLSFSGNNNRAEGLIISNSLIHITGSGNTVAHSLVFGDAGAASVSLTGALTTVITNNTMVGARNQIQISGASSVQLENNILIADGEDHFVIHKLGGAVNSDYNNLVARNGAWIGSFDGFWEHLIYWQQASGQDLNSLSHEPLFVNEGADIYTLQSIQGTFSNGVPVTSANHSPMIDAGNPLSAFGNEPLPTGNRINLGAFGNTTNAAQARLDKSVTLSTANDGGVLRGTNVVLRWLSSNLTGGDTVSIQYSADGGSSWTNVVTGLTPTPNSYVWDTTGFQQSLGASLRVVLDSNTNILDEIDTQISLRHTPLEFFVNDTNTVGDVLTSVAGSSGADGLSSNTPKDSVQGILDAYDVEGSDIIWVDVGEYVLTEPIEWIWSNRGGELGSNVFLCGAGRDSLIDGPSLATNQAAFLIHADAVTLRDIQVSGNGVGVRWATNLNASVERSWLVSNRVGIAVDGSDNGRIANNLFIENELRGVTVTSSDDLTIENNTFVQTNGVAVANTSGSGLILQNSIFDLGTNALAVSGALGGLFMDYNVFDLEAGAPFAAGFNTLRDWQLAFNHDFRSAITNAGFFNPGADDYHLLSSEGRYDPVAGNYVTSDVVIAWAVDKANPDTDEGLEPEENGDRANIGAFGATEFASKGLAPTQEVLLVRSLNEPFVIAETNSLQPLIWHALNVPTNLMVDVEFSGDGGTTWITISNVNAYQEFIVWQPTPMFNTFSGRWRVIGTTNSTVYADTNNAPGEIFFGEFEILSISNAPSGLQKIQWNGAWDETYEIQYTEPQVPFVWTNAPTGIGPDQDSLFVAPVGGDLFYEDIESGTNGFRLYRVIQNP